MSANKYYSLAEFIAFYEAGLQAGERIAYTALVKGATGFSNVFSDYIVITKVGNCDVSAANWQRNDFPHCKFFRKVLRWTRCDGTSAAVCRAEQLGSTGTNSFSFTKCLITYTIFYKIINKRG